MGEPRIHVAFLVGSLRMGGAERMMVQTANGLTRKFHISFITLTGGKDLRSLLAEEVRFFSLNKKTSMSAVRSLVSLLKKEKPDVVISTQIHVNLIALLVKLFFYSGPKFILREATSPAAQFAAFGNLKSSLVKRMMKALYPKADAIVAVCKAVKSNLVDNGFAKQDQVYTIYNPAVNNSLMEGMNSGGDDELFHAGVPVIISSGRLAAVKNFPLLIQAFGLLLAKKDARLMIIGEGRERENLVDLINRLQLNGKVKLAGQLLNPYPFMKKSSVYALTSLYEGLPNALIEAMACGIQLVSVDCPGGSREILMDGELGKLVPMQNAEALAEAILFLLEHPVSKEKLQQSSERFNIEKISHDYAVVIESVLKD